MIKRSLLITGLMAVSACSGGFDLPDLRPGADAATDTMDTMTSDVPAAMTAKERLVVAVEGQGCVIDATTINAIMANASLSSTDLAAAAGELEAEGRAVGDQAAGSIRLVSPNCPAV